MPNYDYYCPDCQEKFELNVPIAQRDNPDAIKCPHCGSHHHPKREISAVKLQYTELRSALSRAGDGWQEVQAKIMQRQGLREKNMKGRHQIKMR